MDLAKQRIFLFFPPSFFRTGNQNADVRQKAAYNIRVETLILAYETIKAEDRGSRQTPGASDTDWEGAGLRIISVSSMARLAHSSIVFRMLSIYLSRCPYAAYVAYVAFAAVGRCSLWASRLSLPARRLKDEG